MKYFKLKLKLCVLFWRMNQTAGFPRTLTLDNGKLDEDVILHLRNPEEGPVDISNPNTRLALDLFMSCENSSQQTYTSVRQSLLRRFPDSETELLSYHLVNKLVTNISGVVSIKDDMCIKSCQAIRRTRGMFHLLRASI